MLTLYKTIYSLININSGTKLKTTTYICLQKHKIISLNLNRNKLGADRFCVISLVLSGTGRAVVRNSYLLICGAAVPRGI